MPSNVESDPLFVLLTDALRAGPGSPQWHEAVAQLKSRGAAADGSDEYRLLLEARENLEGGREYREVRAGDGFTRKLMAQIDREPAQGGRSGIPTATIVAAVCGLLVLAVLALVGYKLMPREEASSAAIEALATKANRFFDTAASATFTGALPEGWRTVGALPLDYADGLRAAQPAAPATQPAAQGGGVVWTGTFPADQAFSVDVAVHASQPTTALLLETFVSTDPNFSADKATSSRDLVWQLQGRDQHILLSGSGQTLQSPQPFHDGDTIRLIVDRDVAIIDLVPTGGKPQRLWAGPHELGASARLIGVRFLETGTQGKRDVSVRAIKVMTTPK